MKKKIATAVIMLVLTLAAITAIYIHDKSEYEKDTTRVVEGSFTEGSQASEKDVTPDYEMSSFCTGAITVVGTIGVLGAVLQFIPGKRQES